MSAESFRLANFYVAVGVCAVSDRCAVYVDTVSPPEDGVFHPPNDRKYITVLRVDLRSAKKSVFATIIHNLKRSGIFPGGREECFKPQVNPDNKYYTGLLGSQRDAIVDLIKHICSALDSYIENGRVISGAVIKETSPEALMKLRDREKPQHTNLAPSLIILGSKETDTIVHPFPNSFTGARGNKLR